MTDTHPRRGTEFDWIATDENNNIALMSTAGYGNCPAGESEWMVYMDQLVDALTALIDPPSDDPHTARSAKGPIVYDWQHWDGPYVRVHISGSIITTSVLTELGMDINLVAKIGCRFTEMEEIPDHEIGNRRAEQIAGEGQGKVVAFCKGIVSLHQLALAIALDNRFPAPQLNR